MTKISVLGGFAILAVTLGLRPMILSSWQDETRQHSAVVEWSADLKSIPLPAKTAKPKGANKSAARTIEAAIGKASASLDFNTNSATIRVDSPGVV
jgi:hypothetical protein